MTQESTTQRKQYSGNDSTTAFPTTFSFSANSHIKVILTDTAALETTQVEGTDFTLTGVGVESGGTVTMTIPPATGETLTIKRDPPLTQTKSLPLGGPFPSSTVEAALDLQIEVSQALDEKIGRAMLLAETSAFSDLVLPELEALKVFSVNAAGNGVTLTDASAKGDKGDTGATGATGADGADGAIEGLSPIAGQYVGYDTSAAQAVVRGVGTNRGYIANRYYGGLGAQVHRTDTLVVTVNRMYGCVFQCLERTTFTRIGIKVTVSAGTNARLGIYDWDGTASSRALVVDAGTVSTAGTGIVEATISTTLMPGTYIIAAVFDNTPTVNATFVTTKQADHVGYTGIGGGTGVDLGGGFFTAHTFGTLPDPFGSLTFLNSFYTADMPIISLRVV